jgi:membrane-bound lytic murein transglycosylase D
MPATGKYFDLKQNLFRDERRDVLESTRAALDYLQKLYGMFDDWHLALAAYNWGEGSVSKALARNKARGLPLTYTDLQMPNETRYYVPKLQAVKNIVAQPEMFSVQLPLIHNHPFFKSVPIERDIDVTTAARLAEVKLEDFKALNPQMSRPVILAAGTPQILLPWDNATVFERNMQAQANRQLATWTAWTTPRTMKVDEAARQVDMPASLLRSANGIPNGMLLKAGSTLLVHRKGSLDNDVTEHTADNGQLSLAPEVVLRRV